MKLNWGTAIILFFILFFTLMIGFIVFSFRQNNDLVTPDYYDKGADYTHQMEINNRSAIYADSISINISKQSVIARFAKSFAIHSDSMEINFYRPSDKKLDYKIVTRIASDSIILDKERIKAGHYRVIFSWSHDEKEYQTEKDFFMENR